MTLSSLRTAVYNANMALHRSGLVLYTFGNVSGIDRASGVVIIKPSGVDYAELTADRMVAVSLATGKTVRGKLNPSSDTATHLELYRAFPACGGIVHTHSTMATACAQARTPIRCMGTTHADYFHGDIPVTRALTRGETTGAYERNTGLVIVETFAQRDPTAVPAALVANHGPFAWGATPEEAVHHAVVLEALAAMQVAACVLDPDARRPAEHLIDKHYFRKHGRGAYYGQPSPRSPAPVRGRGAR
jgi:L-ribulose-5-phosphate 4-epimerase